jgi:hypothetical protein
VTTSFVCFVFPFLSLSFPALFCISRSCFVRQFIYSGRESWQRETCAFAFVLLPPFLNLCTSFLFVASRRVWTLDISVVALLLAWIRGRSVTLSGFVLSKRCSNSKAPQSRACQFLEA